MLNLVCVLVMAKQRLNRIFKMALENQVQKDVPVQSNFSDILENSEFVYLNTSRNNINNEFNLDTFNKEIDSVENLENNIEIDDIIEFEMCSE